MRRAYVVELGALDIAQLEAAAQLLQGILGGIQVIEVPAENDAPVEEEAEWDNEGGAIPEVEEERVPDAAFLPPAPMPPMNRQEDFGAGPPPGLG